MKQTRTSSGKRDAARRGALGALGVAACLLLLASFLRSPQESREEGAGEALEKGRDERKGAAGGEYTSTHSRGRFRMGGDGAASETKPTGRAAASPSAAGGSPRSIGATGRKGVDWIRWGDGRTGLRFSLDDDVRVVEERVSEGRYSRVQAPQHVLTKKAGRPALPVRRMDIVLAADGVVGAEVVDGEYREIRTAPPAMALGFVSRSAPESATRRLRVRPSTGRGIVPDTLVRTTPAYRLRQTRGVGVVVHPFQYDYRRGVLRIWTRLDVVIAGAAEQGEGAALSRPFAEFATALFAQPAKRSDSETRSGSGSSPTAFSSLREGDISAESMPGHLLIIAADAFAGHLGDFVAWKRQRGFRVTTLRYPADMGAGAAALGQAIREAYEEDGVTHAMLVGDADLMPVHSSSGNPTDIRYACVSGDDIVRDVFLSRLSADTAESVAYQLGKIVDYEKHPERGGDWYVTGTSVGSNEGRNKSGSVLAKDDWEILDEERENLRAYGFSGVDRMYEDDVRNDDPFPWSAEPHNDILDALNAGRSLVYYLGHGTRTAWLSIGDSDGAQFNTRHIGQGLNNGGRLPFVMDAACLNGDFSASGEDCIAEVLMQTEGDSVGSGAVGVVASTEDMDWDPPIIMLQAFTDQLVADKVGSAGALVTLAVQEAMDWCDAANGTGAATDIMEQVHLFGDPTLGIRTRVPRTVTVDHPDSIRAGDVFRVAVAAAADGAPLEDVDVCLYHGSGIRYVAQTDAAGVAEMTPGLDVADASSLMLTVYDVNLEPVQQTVAVSAGALRFGTDSDALDPAVVGTSYQKQVLVVGGSPPYEWTAGAPLPPGLLLAADTGVISGVPETAGQWTIPLEVIDSVGSAVSKDVAIQAVEPVRIATGPLPPAMVDASYAEALTAQDGMAPLSWSVEAGGLPPGLQLTKDGRIVGTPRRAGTYSVTTRVAGSAGSMAQTDVAVTVESSPTLTVKNTVLPSVDPGEDYFHSFAAAGGAGGGYRWSLAEGELPAGVALSEDGVLSGATQQGGEHAFSVRVEDDSEPPMTAVVEVSLFVHSPVSLATDAIPAAQCGANYEATVEAEGSYAPFVFELRGTDATVAESDESTFDETRAALFSAEVDHHWAEDETEWILDLPFEFPFFGTSHDRVRVGDNGYVVLSDSSPQPMWNAATDNLNQPMIAPFWNDLQFPAPEEHGVFVSTDANSATILWRGCDYLDHHDGQPTHSLAFCATLHADGRIVFRYGEINTTNRVIVGVTDGTDRNSRVLYSHSWVKQAPDPVQDWAFRGDIGFSPPAYPPSWMSVSNAGVLAGVPDAPGTFPFVVHVRDAALNEDTVQLALTVHDDLPADTNEDGDVDNQEILAFIERWHNGEVTRAAVESAVARWRGGPPSRRLVDPASGLIRASGGDAGLRDSAEVLKDSPEIRRARRVRRGDAVPADGARGDRSSGYATLGEITARLTRWSRQFPDRCRSVAIGRSQQGRAVPALLVTDRPERSEPEPAMAVVGAMHGDEPISAELSLALARHLLHRYDEDSRIRSLVDNCEIWILPCLNPDGFEAGTRELDDASDLNRSFPDGTHHPVGTPWSWIVAPASGGPPETTAVMDWATRNRVDGMVSFHSGELVVCYPFGNSPDGTNRTVATEDHEEFIELASRYAADATYIASESAFPGGIVNGAAWYAVPGEMTDWLYRTSGTMGMTVEMSLVKAPGAEQIDDLWQWNRAALLNFMDAVREEGVRGRVLDAATGKPLFARVSLADRKQPVFTDPASGYFHRYVSAEQGTLVAEAFGYQTRSLAFDGDPENREGPAIRLPPASVMAVRQFGDATYAPGSSLSVSLSVSREPESFLPTAVIVSETIPQGWSYAENSTVVERGDECPGEPRVYEGTCSWLLWDGHVDNAAFQFEWATAADGGAAVFEGHLLTRGMKTPTLGEAMQSDQQLRESGFHLSSGWNLVSLDLQPDEPSIDGVLSGAAGVLAVWAWDGKRYVRPQTLEPGRGYWVYSDTPCTVRYDGFHVENSLRQLAGNWNLIGPLARRDSFHSSSEIAAVASWHGSEYRHARVLECGTGYWVLANESAAVSLR